VVTFQSRFGKAEWLQPYTAPTVAQLARDGVRRIDVICPASSATAWKRWKKSMEVRHDFEANGGKGSTTSPA
jgi:ferrochelatase